MHKKLYIFLMSILTAHILSAAIPSEQADQSASRFAHFDSAVFHTEKTLKAEQEPLLTVLEFLLLADEESVPSINIFRGLFFEKYKDLFTEPRPTNRRDFPVTKQQLRVKKINQVSSARALDAYLHTQSDIPQEIKIALYQIDAHIKPKQEVQEDISPEQIAAQKEQDRKLLKNEKIKYKQKKRAEKILSHKENREIFQSTQEQVKEDKNRRIKNRDMHEDKKKDSRKRRADKADHQNVQAAEERRAENQRQLHQKQQAALRKKRRRSE